MVEHATRLPTLVGSPTVSEFHTTLWNRRRGPGRAELPRGFKGPLDMSICGQQRVNMQSGEPLNPASGNTRHGGNRKN
jgi:hypothetical protein